MFNVSAEPASPPAPSSDMTGPGERPGCSGTHGDVPSVALFILKARVAFARRPTASEVPRHPEGRRHPGLTLLSSWPDTDTRVGRRRGRTSRETESGPTAPLKPELGQARPDPGRGRGLTGLLLSHQGAVPQRWGAPRHSRSSPPDAQGNMQVKQ